MTGGSGASFWRRGDGALRSVAAWETHALTKATGGSEIILAHLGRALASPLKMGVKKLWSEGAGSPLFNHHRCTNKHWASAGEISCLHVHGAGVGCPLLHPAPRKNRIFDKCANMCYNKDMLISKNMQAGLRVLCGVLFCALVVACPDEAPGGTQGEGLEFNLLTDLSMLQGFDPRGTVYTGIYTAPDGVQVDVWLVVRAAAASGSSTVLGSVNRLGVVIQGGTGAPVISILGADSGIHTAMLAINMRGSSLTDLTAAGECIPGGGFIACLRSHSGFARTNPRLNAQDANAIIAYFAEDKTLRVNGQNMPASGMLTAGTITSPVNLLTGSFGGVLVGYMLAEPDRPQLHNVMLEQITSPIEKPISLGVDAAHTMLNILLEACEDDTTCIAAYPSIRANFIDFMHDYANTQISVDTEMIYASGVFDRIVHIIESENKVGKAIRYIGEIANDHAMSSTVVTDAYAPTDYTPMFAEQPRAQYGFIPFDMAVPEWPMLLGASGGFFPGLTNRTAMICSFGINRATDPDTLANYNKEFAVELNTVTGYEGLTAGTYTKGTLAYGFLILYNQYLSICPQVTAQSGGLVVPKGGSAISNIPANNVIIFVGGLDVKHDLADAQEMEKYFQSDRVHLINQKYLGQATGEDHSCLPRITDNLWEQDAPLTAGTPSAPGTLFTALDDDCTATNSATASGLTGW